MLTRYFAKLLLLSFFLLGFSLVAHAQCPDIYAGPATTICKTDNYTTTLATANQFQSVLWTSSGTGIFLNADQLTGATYVPSNADLNAGSVILTITATPLATCTSGLTYQSQLILSFRDEPTENAGIDQTININESVTLNGSATNYATVLWISDGDGTFSNSGLLDPIYIPGPLDIAAGEATLTLTNNGVFPCNGQYTDQMNITINPSLNAGADQNICANETPSMNASASNYSSITWTTDGDGRFSDANILNPVYFPGTNDIASGVVNLTVTTIIAVPSGGSNNDQVRITIGPLPVVNAGVDIQSCGLSDVQLNATATDYNPGSIVWSGGGGSFNSTSILNPIYTPTLAELDAGQVILTITVTGQDPCFTDISDNITIQLLRAEIDAGGDMIGCLNESVFINNATSRDVSVVWTTSGTGTFDDNTLVNPTYTPSATDYLNAPITLTMTATPDGSCASPVIDQMQILSFRTAPTAFAGTETTICQTDTYTTNFASTNGEESALQWSSGGDGSFGGNQNQLVATYTPGALDIQRGYADLTLTAFPIAPCANPATHTFRLNIQRTAVMSAGDDELVCEGSSIELTTASAQLATGVTWSTSGSGTFSDINAVNPIYYPSAADITSGVVLTISGDSESPCAGTVTDNMNLTGVLNPTGSAGADANICETNNYFIADAVANNYANVVWTTSGDGNFSNANILNPTYNPGPNDIVAGGVTLELTIVGRPPCVTNVVDQLVLTLSKAPVINAGNDVAICETATYTTNATVANHSSFEWTTSGDGTFNNAAAVNNVYTPGPLDIENGLVTLTLRATGITPCDDDFFDSFDLTINKNPEGTAGPDESICAIPHTLTNAIARDYANVIWTSDGSSGTITNANSLTPTYTASVTDIERGYVNLTLTINPISPCGVIITDDVRLDIQALPVVEAGPDASICEGDNYVVVGAQVENHNNYQWTTNGSGTFLNGTNHLSPTYIPSPEDIAAGNVLITLTANSIGPCDQDISDAFNLRIESMPIVNAGNNGNVCENGTYTTAEASVLHTSSPVQWTSSGDGTFDNANLVNTVYTPGNIDRINGSFRLTITAQSDAPCSGTVSDHLDVTVIDLPTAEAGSDFSNLCAGDIITITEATAENHSAVIWTTSGSGVIANANTLTPSYTLSDNDALLGTITLTMEAFGNDPCATSVTDEILVHVNPNVIVFAGNDFSICEGDVFTITDATATNYSEVSWTSSGTGVFSNRNTLTPTYTPSVEDIAAGSVNLILTGTGNASCSERTDNIIITINRNPIADAGTTTDICSGPSLIEGAAADHYTSISWSTSGTGLFDFANTLTPTYTPSAADLANGQVSITLTATPINPCGANATSSILINVHQAPIIDAGENDTICVGETYSLASAVSQHVTNVVWTTSGTGSFADPNITNTVYTPSTQDIALGNITLTLTGGNASCTDVNDYMVLSIQEDPTVYAGQDSTLCSTGSYVVRDAVFTNYSSLSWTHNGTGTLTGANTNSPVYTAGPGDFAAGRVTLSVEVTALSPCVGTLNDVLFLDVKHPPTAYAGVDSTICVNETYTVVGATATDYESILWTSSGNGAFVNGATLTPTYHPSQEDLDRGNVELRMHVNNSPCNMVTDQMTLTFALLPEVNAGFDASVNIGSSFTITSASATIHNGIVWTSSGTGTFSDNSIINPTYTPSDQDLAIGNVVLTLTGLGISPCSNVSDEMILRVTDNPDLRFTWENNCINTLIQFVIDRDVTNVGEIVSWNWDFGDGNTSVAMEPAHLYSVAGTYAVSLTVVDINNYTTVVTENVVINLLPLANFSYSVPSCSNLETQFTDHSNTPEGYIVRWDYDFGDGNTRTIDFPEDPNISHSYELAGTYTAILTVTNSLGCSNSLSRQITIIPSPVASFNMHSYCVDGNAQFEDLSQENSGGLITSYMWDFGDPESGIDNTSNLRNPTHLYRNNGTYNISLTVTNANGCTNTLTQTFDVTIQPAVDFYTEGGSCIGNQIAFYLDTDVVNLLNLQSVEWDFGDGSPISGELTARHTYTDAGTYTVSLTVFNQGCQSSISYPITIQPSPTASFEVTNACQNNTTQFTDFSAGANYQIESWYWDFGDSGRTDDNSTLQNPAYAYLNSGTFDTKLIITDFNGCTDTAELAVEIYPSPISAFSYENNFEDTQGRIQLINESTNANEFVWDFGDGVASSEENPIHGFTQDGTYTITLVSLNEFNCPDTSSLVYQVLFKGLYVPNAFSPGSANEQINKFNAIGMNLSEYLIEVFDSWGAKVWQSNALDENGSPSEAWDGTFKGTLLPQGVYTWKVRAVFQDGSVWNGSSLGNNAGGSGKTSGTVTLIR